MPLALHQCTLTDDVMLMDCTLPAFTLDNTLPAVSLLWRVQLDGWAKITPGRDYKTFSAWLCALDLFIPLDALGQKKTWAPRHRAAGEESGATGSAGLYKWRAESLQLWARRWSPG